MTNALRVLFARRESPSPQDRCLACDVALPQLPAYVRDGQLRAIRKDEGVRSAVRMPDAVSPERRPVVPDEPPCAGRPDFSLKLEITMLPEQQAEGWPVGSGESEPVAVGSIPIPFGQVDRSPVSAVL